MDVNKMIESNMGLMYKQLHTFGLKNDPEAVSLALEALWNAVVTYKDGTGAKFSTYASVCIYNALGGYVRHMKRKNQLEVISYDIPIAASNDDTIEIFIKGHCSAEDAYLHGEFDKYILSAIDKVIDSFPPDHRRELVQYWIDSYCTAKQRELSDKFGVSQSYASRVLSMAKYRLKKELEEYLCEK